MGTSQNRPKDPGSSPASRLGSYAAKWIDNVTEQAAANLNAQSKLLKDYDGDSIVSDIQDVTKTVYAIWFDGISKLLQK
jgi:hypothetical protein